MQTKLSNGISIDTSQQHIKNAITCDQARYIHAIWLPAALGLLATSCFVYWQYYDIVDPYLLNSWFGVSLLNATYQVVYWFRFRNIGADFSKARRCLHWSALNGFIAALVWVMATVFILQKGGETEQFTFILILIIISLSSIFSVGPHLPTFFGFFLGCMIPLTLMVSLGYTNMVSYFYIILVLYIAFSSSVAFLFSRMFLRSLQLRFENIDLVKQLTIQKEAAESANLAKSRFLAAASHDLRQPMHALSLYLSAMKEQFSAEKLPLLNQAMQCANTMEEMFRALLDVSRLDAQVIKPDKTNFMIGTLLERIQTEFEPEAHAKGLQLRLVPSTLIVDSDQALVGRILRNIISNAVRYTEKGKILIGCRRQKDLVNVYIYDTGIGITEDKQKTIFEEFYQVGNPERDRNKGLGLGLAIVDRISKLLNHNIILRSRIDQGSCFQLQLDRVNEFTVLAGKNPDHMSISGSLTGRIAAVVDDEDEILNATRALLESWKMKVLTDNNGTQIKKQLIDKDIVPDILICDYRLRDNHNGLDVVNELREEFNLEIPAIIITGDTASQRIQAIESSGLLALHKPVDEIELKSTLLRLIQ